MSSWRKKLFVVILIALVVCAIAFWGTAAGGCCLLALIQSILIYLFGNFASSDLAKIFEEEGKHVKGWRG